ncbi:substrate-binding domain-containing protein [Xylophilus rhododendri]|uniref:Substrate-binding domain-containing protein n=1 Tax=Xylophilus rhododendri TaxID=2697032 RepID=A0A857J603_9BURK|nr:LacI family DNA-binding transcriptional regulator [Xylophilus rhododendri]QHI99256.1 substrate-binding domain-containing protein [Xylophilus rhododendri]
MRSGANAQAVAELAKVSQSAVSRTFTPGASVSEDTRARVLAAAKTLGYRPNALARSLITRRSQIIALVMGYLENQFYPLVIEKLSQKLQKQGYHVLMFITEQDEQTDGVLAEILQYQVDGVVMASAMLSPDLARQCADTGVPVVMFNRVPQTHAFASHGTSAVTSDNRRGGRLVAELLLARGYRRIAFLAGLENSSTNLERERGFHEAMAEARMPVFASAHGHYDFERAKQATRELFAGEEKPDALFVANDHMAIAALDVLRQELGLKVPQEVGVVGFDDVPQAAWGAYRLTTVVQSVEEMVEATVGLLHEQMREDAAPRNVVIPCRIVERDTVRAA